MSIVAKLYCDHCQCSVEVTAVEGYFDQGFFPEIPDGWKEDGVGGHFCPEGWIERQIERKQEELKALRAKRGVYT